MSINFAVIEAVLVNHIFTIKLEVATLNLLAFSIFMKLLSVFSTLVGYRLWHFCFVRTLNGFIYLITALARSYLSTLVPQEHIGTKFCTKQMIFLGTRNVYLLLKFCYRKNIWHFNSGGMSHASICSSILCRDFQWDDS